MSSFRLSILASCLSIAYFSSIEPDFHYLFWHHMSRFSSSSSAPCPSIAYLLRHHIQLSSIFIGIVSGSLIFPGIVLGFLLVLQLWRLSSISLRYWVKGQNCWSFGFFTRVHFTLKSLVLHTHNSLVHSLY